MPERTPDPEARAALVATLRRWVAAVRAPRLGRWGVTLTSIPGLVAESRGSSMRTNPIVLDEEELAAILRSSL